MKARPFFAGAGMLVTCVIAIFLWQRCSGRSSPRAIIDSPSAPLAPKGRSSRDGRSDDSHSSTQMPGGPYQTNDPRWKERRERLKTDRSYEWKTPISFYAKVIDQDNHPVPGVEVQLDWNDTSLKGTSFGTRVTDGSGHFSITGIRGKILGVRSLSKPGYVEAKASNRYSFEYAGFWEPDYHEPDPNNPVIFHLRKRGQAEPLLTIAGKVVVEFGAAVPIPMPKGAPDGGNDRIRIAVIESDGKANLWRAHMAVEGGGLVPALDEFPFLAPESGYESELDLDQNSPQPRGWQAIDEGGRFYFKSSFGYGLLELRQMKGKKTLHYMIRLNPSGSRNLEPSS